MIGADPNRSEVATDRAGAQRFLDDWGRAITANDPARISAFVAPDWVLVTPESGLIPLDRFLGVVADGSLTHSAMSFDIIDVRDYVDIVVVIAHGTNSGTWNGEPFSADEIVTEVLVRNGDTWRCTVSALTPHSRT